VLKWQEKKTVKFPPRRRGEKLTVHQIRRAVRKVIRERFEREAREAAEQANAKVAESKAPSTIA